MRWIPIFVTVMALAACSSSSNSDQTQIPESAPTTGQSQPMQQEKTADVKTEAAGEAFQKGMMQPDKMMQAMQKQAPTTSTEAVAKVIGTTWKRCAACHNFTNAPKVGPGLAKIIGRKAGSMTNFHYRFTQYIKGKSWVWDETHLRKWMCNSTEAIKAFTGDPNAQTMMPAQHICKPEDQDSVLSKLRAIS